MEPRCMEVLGHGLADLDTEGALHCVVPSWFLKIENAQPLAICMFRYDACTDSETLKPLNHAALVLLVSNVLDLIGRWATRPPPDTGGLHADWPDLRHHHALEARRDVRTVVQRALDLVQELGCRGASLLALYGACLWQGLAWPPTRIYAISSRESLADPLACTTPGCSTSPVLLALWNTLLLRFTCCEHPTPRT
ncbi:uncharacterized protein SPSK_00899 [Sporothrix schenckii 1099-18]|uniref:Uncharacterized protein n=1 Tax=Sporothrix schenckii 1099-18 TaxID=1397361 RepID=A0A0F2LWI7_SPOSC|nr:uncharacterized protein SPSK_00899 [Sporothrix schenckii 1099-18]KJR81837.1 hypothetical protein SPSK_00899 [Sporothrix schenckii 1099-18]